MRHSTKALILSFLILFLLKFNIYAGSIFFIPSVNTDPVTGITDDEATSGGNGINDDGGSLVDKGIVWAEYSGSDDPIVDDDNASSAGSSPSDYSLNLSGLNPETRYEVRAYIVVDNDTLYGSTLDFYSLSSAPTNQDVNFSTNAVSPTSIQLTFDDPSSIGADGYILLRRDDGTYPDLSGIQNGQDIPGSYPAGTTNVTILNDGDNPYTDSGLDPNQQYHYSIIPFNYDGANTSTYHYIYDAANHSSNETTGPAEASDIISADNETGDILYANYTSSTVNNTSDALQVWSMTLRDGGGSNDNDGLATTLTDLEITPGTGNSVGGWSSAINRAVLFVGGTKQGETTPSGNNLTFSGLNISAAQNSSSQIDLYLTFNNADGSVVDGERFVFEITSATVSGSGSQMAALGTVNSQNATGTNEIEVEAETFELSNYPAQIDSGAVFDLDVEAIDNAGNKDLDANFSITVLGGATSITSDAGTIQNLVSGDHSWNDLKLHPPQASVVNVEVTGGGLTPQSFDILVLVPGVVVSPADTLEFCSQSGVLPLDDITITEGSNDDFQVGTDVWYTIELPNGYQFVDNSTDDILFASSSDLSGFDKSAYTNGNRRYNFRFDVNTTNELDTIFIEGLEIEKTGTGSDTLEIHREFTGGIPGESSVVSAVQFKNDPNQQVHGVVLSNSVDNIILNSNEGNGPVCSGDEVTFTGYGASSYEFFINDVIQSSTGNTFSTEALQNNDIVKVKGYIGTCVDSAEIQMNVQTKPTVNITSPNYGAIDQDDPNPILISSDEVELDATPIGGVFSGTGVKKIGSTYFFDPEEAGVGVHSVLYDVTTGVCTVLDSVQFSVESPSGGNVAYFDGLEAQYCEDDNRSLLTWPYNESIFPVIRYNGPGVVEDPAGSGTWYFDPKLALDSAGPGLTSVYVTYGYSFIPGSEFNLPPQTTFVYAKPTVSFTVNQNGNNKPLPEYFCGNEQSVQLNGNPVGAFANGKIYFTITDLDNNITDTLDANDPKVFDPQDYVSATPRHFAITYNYTSQVSGCFNSYSDTTTVLPVPRAVDNSDIQDVSYCEGETIEFLNVNSGNDHLTRWYDKDNGNVVSELDSIFPTIFGTGEKQYEAVFVTNDLSTCQGPKKTVTITVNPNPNLVLDGLDNTGYCIDNEDPITITPSVNGGTPPIQSNVEFRWMRTSPDTLDYGVFTQNPIPSDYPKGDYVVSFSYTDNNNCSSTIYQSTKINPLPAVDFTGLDSIYCADASPATLTHIINTSDNSLDNTDLLYEIDKNSQGNFANLGVRVFDPQSILAGIGQHQVRLTYTDNLGCSNDTVKTVEVLPLPEANFVIDKFCEDAPTLFTDSSRVLSSFAGDSVIKHSWDFGDGDFLATGSGSITSNTHNGRTEGTFFNPQHTYQNGDDYVVTHSIETQHGCTRSVTKNLLIGAPPEADFSAKGFCEGDAVKFYDLSTPSTGSLAMWNWDFGDANTSNMQNPDHVYSGTGRFSVELKVYSDLGCVDSVEKEIIKFPRVTASSLPYLDEFDGTMAEWIVSGDNSSWQKDLPDGEKVPAHEGNAWVTQNAEASYNHLENSWVESPCFDLTNLTRPVANLDLYKDLEEDVDGTVLQMTFDDGQTWYEVGDDASGLNWFNAKGLPSNPGMQTTGINYGWTGHDEDWQEAKYALDTYIDTLSKDSRVRFRIAIGSNLTNPGNQEFGGFAFDNFHLGSRNRMVLLEHFTNSNLSGYSNAIATIDNFVQNKGEELVNLVYHNSYPSPDENFSFNPEDLETRSFYYGISEGPVSVVDGHLNTLPFEQWGTTFYNNETLSTSPFAVSLDNVSSNSDELDLEIELISGVTRADTFNVYVVLAEKVDDLYVAREILPKPSGKRIEKEWTTGESFVMDINTSTKVYDNPDNMHLITFLQNPYSKEIYQSSVIAAGALPQVITGLGDELSADQFAVYPNPFSQHLNVKFDADAQKNIGIKMFDENGQLVLEKEIDNDHVTPLNLGLLQSGVYILQITGEQKVAYKKVVKF